MTTNKPLADLLKGERANKTSAKPWRRHVPDRRCRPSCCSVPAGSGEAVQKVNISVLQNKKPQDL